MSRASFVLAVVVGVRDSQHCVSGSPSGEPVGIGSRLANLNHQPWDRRQRLLRRVPPPHSRPPTQPAFQFLLANSPALSTASWALVGGVWIWRGRMKSRWESLGFDSGIFDLFIKMKGAKTRMNLLDSLSMPKDRLQLARELGVRLEGRRLPHHPAQQVWSGPRRPRLREREDVHAHEAGRDPASTAQGVQ